MNLTWASFNNLRMFLMACMPVIIFYLIWLVNTSESIRIEEGALLDLICWPDGNAIPVIIACGAIIAVVIEIYGLYQLFKAGQPKQEYDVTNGLFYYIWALIVIIIIFLAIMFYSGLQSTIIRAKIKGGITKAMLRYAHHLPSKVAIDRLQTRFHCCGRVAYQEWFFIPWFTDGVNEDSDKIMFADRKFVADNVPYSCCAMDELYPCIHHGVTQVGVIYKYNPAKQLTISNDGCEEKLISEMMSVSWRFNAVMALIILAMVGDIFLHLYDCPLSPDTRILQIVAVRYLHTAYKNGLHAGNKFTCRSYLLGSRTDTEAPNTPPKRKVFRKRRPKDSTMTLQWITGYGYRKRRFTSSSDNASSDELLKPINE